MSMPINLGRADAVQNFIRTASFLLTFLVLLGLDFIFFGLIGLKGAGPLIVPFLLFNLWLSSVVSKIFHILPEWERLVLLRLGKFSGIKGPGFFIIPPFVYSVASIIDTRITTHQVEATDTLTKDNVPTKITAAIEFQIENPQKAIIDVQNYLRSVIWLSTEALKNTVGSLDLKELLGSREEIAASLKIQIDKTAEEYGINIRAVRITDISTPKELVEELAVIARAKRAAEAKQIQAEAEVLVAKKVDQASRILNKSKGAFRLREIQNIAEISKEESSMIIIYPYDSATGKEISQAAVALTQKKPKKA